MDRLTSTVNYLLFLLDILYHWLINWVTIKSITVFVTLIPKWLMSKGSKGRLFHLKETLGKINYVIISKTWYCATFHFIIPFWECPSGLNIANIHKYFSFKTGLNFGNNQKSIWHTGLATKRIIFFMEMKMLMSEFYSHFW